MSDFVQTDQKVIDARNRLMKAIEALFTARYDQLLGTAKDLTDSHTAEHALTVAIIDVEETSEDVGIVRGYEHGYDERDRREDYDNDLRKIKITEESIKQALERSKK